MELLPCPFCHQSVSWYMFDMDYGVQLRHPSEPCLMGAIIESTPALFTFDDPHKQDDFERLWNTRVTPPASQPALKTESEGQPRRPNPS